MRYVHFKKKLVLSLFLLCSIKMSLANITDSLFNTNNSISLSSYEHSLEQLKKSNFDISPSSYIIQYAGSIGKISIGAGWEYGKNKKWATDFLIGYVPKYETSSSKITLTIRQNLTPWAVQINDNITYYPLRTGLYLSTTLGNQFWYSAPDKYPSDYYTFSTKIRANIYLGQAFSFNVFNHIKYLKKVDFYYDLHTTDFMLISKVQNRSLKNFDYLGLALGLKIRI